ncbi:MAG: response regulator [Elusimicrobiota bacterium]
MTTEKIHKHNPAEATGNNPEVPTKPLMVLVVDDEPGFCQMLKWELTNQGMHVETAVDGTEGVQLVSQKKFDVVITDITMPRMDGLKLLQEIKSISPETEVIVATGFAAVETAVFAMQKGAFDFVLKPYNLEHLISRVKKAVERLSRCKTCGKFTHNE